MAKKSKTKNGESRNTEADKIMSKIETGLVNKRYATAQMLEPSLGLKASKAEGKSKAKKRG